MDLDKINNRFRKQIDKRIKNVIDSSRYILGNQNSMFEKHFAKFCGVKHCIGCANGLESLSLIIRGYGFCKGDEIIVPANTYIATIFAISENGCVPNKQLAYKEYSNLYLPITEKIHKEVISLPISPVMTKKEIKYVVDVINKF